MPTYHIFDEQGNELTPTSKLDYLAMRRLLNRAESLNREARSQLLKEQPLARQLHHYVYTKRDSLKDLLEEVRRTAEQNPTVLTQIISTTLTRLNAAGPHNQGFIPKPQQDRIILIILAALGKDDKKYADSIQAVAKIIVEFPFGDDQRNTYIHTRAIANRWLQQMGKPTQEPIDLGDLAIAFSITVDEDIIEALPTVYTKIERDTLLDSIEGYLESEHQEAQFKKWSRTLAERAIQEGSKRVQKQAENQKSTKPR